MSTTIANPGDRYTRTKKTRNTNFELWGWLFMRISGVILVVLIFGHLFVNLMMGEGIKAIDFAFVGGKWSSPFWKVWDLLMLWLAMIHGTNGVRTVVNDYAEKKLTRKIFMGLLLIGFTVTVVLGTLVIFTFEPCPIDAPAELLASFCTGS